MRGRAKRRPAKGLYPEYRRDLLGLRIGLHPVSVTRILLGRQGVAGETLAKLAEALGVEVGVLDGQLKTLRTPAEECALGTVGFSE